MKPNRGFLRHVMLWVNVALIASVCVLNYFYQTQSFNYTLKCRTSTCFAVLAVLNLLWSLWADRQNWKVYALLCLGLLLARQGDLAINHNFVKGASIFAAGHVFLVAAYCVAQPPRWKDLLWILPPALGSLAFLLFYPYLFFTYSSQRTVCFVYAVIISCMLGKAVSNFCRRPSLFTGLLAGGSALFFFSDFMLLLHWFVRRWRWTDNACMATYYPAVCLIALAIFVLLRRQTQKVRYI